MHSLTQECVIEEVSEDGTNDEPVKSSKGSKKANGPDASKASASLDFKIISKVPYKTVVKGVHLLVCRVPR